MAFVWVLLGTFLLSVILGFAAGFYDGRADGQSGEAPIAHFVTQTDAGFWLVAVIGLLVGGVSLWSGIKWYRGIDEAAQRAHLEAWYWGASIAMFMPMPFITGWIVSPHMMVGWFESWAVSNTQAAALGAMALYLVLLMGYCVAWGVWWWRRR
ncbi:MAG: hypothetical protein MUF14_04150 [Hyphomonadaceae bacterium]|nr:hypothetical protein [Hyphomonadaceae bacterium]